MVSRPLGRTGLRLSPIGFGAFKIGRNTATKYPQDYELPSEQDAAALLNAVLDAGINLIDTAPAYGLSEERIGTAIAHRRHEFVLCTKVGEIFEDGKSRYDFSSSGMRRSIETSLSRLRTDAIDILLLHAPAQDVAVLEKTRAVETLRQLRGEGLAHFVGLSGKTLAAERMALAWADVLMVEFNSVDRSHEPIIAEAASSGVGVLVKKPLASGALPAAEALRFVLADARVACAVVGGLNQKHLRGNIGAAVLSAGPRFPT